MEAKVAVDAGRVRLEWIVGTLPLALLAGAIHVLTEWLFFATKVSSLTILTPLERVLVLFQTPGPFVPYLVGGQVVFTALSLLPPRRARNVAAIPAALLLASTAFVMFDNFTYVTMGYSSLDASSWLVYPYAALTILFVVILARGIGRVILPLFDRRGLHSVHLVVWLAVAPACSFFVWSTLARGEPPVLPHRAAGTTAPMPNILILTADGIDAVHVSAYGYSEPTTPVLARVREESLFCENAFANAARTHGSLTSMLTGKLPTDTRVTFPPTSLTGDARYQHLPGILGRHGYQRLQLTMRHYADAGDTNMLGAFDQSNYRWEDVLRLNPAPEAADTSRVFRNQVVDRITERIQHVFRLGEASDAFRYVMGRRASIFWSDDRRIETLTTFIRTARQPWFAQVHLTDSHEGEPRLDASPSEPALHEYDAVVRAADDRMGRVLDALRRSGQLDSTILVLGSDHGRYWHTRQRVPLMIRFPHGAHRRIESQNVQLLDVAPTLLHYLEIPVPQWMPGRSLLSVPVPARPIHSVHDIGAQRFEASRINSLENPGPPNSGVRTAGVVLGSTWYELDLEDGQFQFGPIVGHTRPQSADPTVASSLLSRHLGEKGFQILPGALAAAAPSDARLTADAARGD